MARDDGSNSSVKRGAQRAGRAARAVNTTGRTVRNRIANDDFGITNSVEQGVGRAIHGARSNAARVAMAGNYGQRYVGAHRAGSAAKDTASRRNNSSPPKSEQRYTGTRKSNFNLKRAAGNRLRRG